MSYELFPRRSFLYYFDRLHLNHFSIDSLAALLAQYGLGHADSSRYAFPYVDGNDYPAVGLVARKGVTKGEIRSPKLRDALERYLTSEKVRALQIADTLNVHERILVWGAGDNFYRSMMNGGPLSNLKNLILIDKTPRKILIGKNEYHSIEPLAGLRKFKCPVAITVSGGSQALVEQILAIDPHRTIFLL